MMEQIPTRNAAVPADRFSCSSKIQSLAASDCPAFFPADVIRNGKTIHLCYATGAYLPLHRYPSMNTEKVFSVIKSVLLHVDTARDWLWFPEDYVISADTVWMDGRGQVRMLCIPDGQAVSYPRRMKGFLHELKRLSEPAVSSCLDYLGELLENGICRTGQLLSEMDQMLAEVQSYF